MPDPDITLERAQDRDGRVTVRVLAGGELFTVFHAEAQPKPYFYPLLAPGGVPVTRGYPLEDRSDEEHDHPHHVSLWFAHGDVDGHDFWAGTGGVERIRLAYLIESPEVPDVLLASHEWVVDEGEDTRVVCEQETRFRFGADADARWIDVTVTLNAPMDADGPVRFGDTKEGTFALRLAPTLRVKGAVARGSLRNSEGQLDGEAWGKRARWLAASGPVDGSNVTVALFDHPENPSHPTWWHARTYGLLAANPFGVHDFEGVEPGTGDVVVPAGENLAFRYRLRVADDVTSSQELDETWHGFAADDASPGH